LALTKPGDERAAAISEGLSTAISEARTISYLLHPPLLDEVGFASAANWLIKGFAERTGAKVSSEIAEIRLSREAELVLYRVLQEALTNIHRHADSKSAEIRFYQDSGGVALTIRDFGRGIAVETLEAIRTGGSELGVGLTGMRERVTEQNGTIEIQSGEAGTEIAVHLPRTSVNGTRVPAADDGAAKPQTFAALR